MFAVVVRRIQAQYDYLWQYMLRVIIFALRTKRIQPYRLVILVTIFEKDNLK